ncbi:MAG: DNA polymerase III subunit beta, partial [Ilumatobacteraceae bacterium]
MKFTANTTDLAAVLAKCAAITPGRSPLPILSNVLLCAENGQVKVKSTDLDLLLAASIEADVDEEGAITLPAKRLAAIVKEMPSETVTITLDGQNAKLVSGKSRVTLNGLSAEEFPVLDDDGEGRVISMHGSELTGVIRRIAFAASTDESRYILNGVLLEFKEGDFKAVATDGKRLAVESLSSEGLEGEDFAKIIPNKAIHAI